MSKRTYSDTKWGGVTITALVDRFELASADDAVDREDGRPCRVATAGNYTLQNVCLPFGASRIAHVYQISGGKWVNSRPEIATQPHPLTCQILSGADGSDCAAHEHALICESNGSRIAPWQFSLASLFLQTSAYPAFRAEQDKTIEKEYRAMVDAFRAAIRDNNRDALAVVYAHLNPLMTTYFRMHARVVATLDLAVLLPYIASLYTDGIQAALEPVWIPLWSHAKKHVFQRVTTQQDESDAESEAIAASDEEDLFDPNVAMYTDAGSGKMHEILLLKGPPRQVFRSSTADPIAPGAIVVDGLCMASRSMADVVLPFPTKPPPPGRWAAYAVLNAVARAFSVEGHYFLTIDMLLARMIQANRLIDKAPVTEQVSRDSVAAVLNHMAGRSTLVLTHAGAVIRAVTNDLVAAEMAGEDAHDRGRLRIYLPMAWQQEAEIADRIGAVVAKPDAPPCEVGAGDPELEGLCDEQVDAAIHAVTRPLTVVTGPGGSGKTTVMCAIYAILRARYGASAQFLFMSFRNGIVMRMAAKITGSAMAAADEDTSLSFMTCDAVVCALTRGKRIRPVVIFMEEAGQTCGAHVQGLLRAISIEHLRHLIMIGDTRQRAPIRQGTPFAHISRMYPGHVRALSRIHRTNCAELVARQTAILRGRAVAALAQSDDPSFAWIPVESDGWRMAPLAVRRFGEAVAAALVRIDPDASRYESVVGLCPYNDFCAVGDAVIVKHYFDKEMDMDAAYACIESRRAPLIYKNMRVVFTKTRKDNSDTRDGFGVYSRGQIGYVACIWPDILGAPPAPLPSAVESAASASLAHVGEITGRAAVFIRTADTGEIVMLYCGANGSGLAHKIRGANFVTVDRAQGMEFPHVIAMCAPGTFLADNSVVYVMATRAMHSLTLVGSESHISKMIRTPPERKTSQLPDRYIEEAD